MKIKKHTYPDGKSSYTTSDIITVEINKQKPSQSVYLDSETVELEIDITEKVKR